MNEDDDEMKRPKRLVVTNADSREDLIALTNPSVSTIMESLVDLLEGFEANRIYRVEVVVYRDEE